jgi:hypothetical protein
MSQRRISIRRSTCAARRTCWHVQALLCQSQTANWHGCAMATGEQSFPTSVMRVLAIRLRGRGAIWALICPSGWTPNGGDVRIHRVSLKSSSTIFS